MANSILRVVASLVGASGSNVTSRNAWSSTTATASSSTLKDLRRIRTESAPRLVDEIVIVVCWSNQLSNTVCVVVELSLWNGQRMLVLTSN